jgi:hypothetical protein
VNVSLPECPYLDPGLKLTDLIKQWSQTLAMPEDTTTVLLEILKFLGTVALIPVIAVIMLMAG